MIENAENICLNTLSTKAFLHVNYQLMQTLGLFEATLIGYFIDKYEYHKARGELIEEKWFYIKNQKLQAILNLTDYRRREIVAILETAKVLESKLKGKPPRVHYCINFEELEKYLREDPMYLNRREIKRKAGKVRHHLNLVTVNNLKFGDGQQFKKDVSKTSKIGNLVTVNKTDPNLLTVNSIIGDRQQITPINNVRANRLDQRSDQNKGKKEIYKERKKEAISSQPKKKRTQKPKPEKKAYGSEFHNVLLTDDQYEKLLKRFNSNDEKRQFWIERLDKAIEQHGYKYKSHYATIINWSDNKPYEYDDWKREQRRQNKIRLTKQPIPLDQISWNMILQQLQTQINAKTLNAWFKDASLVTLTETACVIGVSDEIQKQWIMKYTDHLIETFISLLGYSVEIDFHIQKGEG